MENQVITKKTIIFTTDYDMDYYRDDYKTEVLKEGETFNENDFYNWFNDVTETDWPDFIGNLKYSKYYNNDFVINGSIETWQGNRNILSVVCENVQTAIEKCLGDDDNEIYIQDGEIHVVATHHDGTNHFTISMLNKRATNALENDKDIDLTNQYYHKKIKGYLF